MTQTASRSSRVTLRDRASLTGYIWLAVLTFAVWTLLSVTGLVREAILPKPSDVAHAGWTARAELSSQFITTMRTSLTAVLIVWVVGLLVAKLFVNFVPSGLNVVRAAYSFPIVAIFPLIIIWFGYESTGRIIYASIFGLPPMILLSVAAIRSIDSNIHRLFRSLGASPVRTAIQGTLPAAANGILGAMRTAGALAVVGVVTGELLASDKGLGHWVAIASSHFDMPSVYAGIILVISLAVGLHIILTLAQIMLDKAGLS